MSIDILDKQNVVCTYNGISALKRKEISDTCYYIDEAIRHYAEEKYSKISLI